MGYTGEGKDRNIWKGRLGVTELNPKVANDLTTKKYVDDNSGLFNVNIMLTLLGAVLTLNGNVLILQ